MLARLWRGGQWLAFVLTMTLFPAALGSELTPDFGDEVVEEEYQFIGSACQGTLEGLHCDGRPRDC